MSEWVSILAVFWALWAVDGAKLARGRVFTAVGGGWRGRSRAALTHSRLSLPGVSPRGWRHATADLPFSLSPVGISNRVVGSAGRPAETAPLPRAWRWDEIRRVGIAGGTVFINDEPFCTDTGHLPPTQLLALALLPAESRGRRIEAWLQTWTRPHHLRRRARVLERRTRWVAAFNLSAFIGLIVLTLYVVADVPSRVPTAWSERIADLLPWVILALFALHVAAVIVAARAIRRLKPVQRQKRGANLWSAALLPPQALRLRTLAGEGFFPAQHPLAVALAFGGRRVRENVAFATLADLRWPLPVADAGALSDEIAAWFSASLERRVNALLTEAGVKSADVLAPPRADMRGSQAYCPRCRDQFVAAHGVCPQGIRLEPVRR